MVKEAPVLMTNETAGNGTLAYSATIEGERRPLSIVNEEVHDEDNWV